MHLNYSAFIADNFHIVDKSGLLIPFNLNPIQCKFMDTDADRRDIVLKARQQGFSSAILGRFTTDFLMKPNSNNVVVADIAENAETLLGRVKLFIKSYEEINGVKVPLKTNSRTELTNEVLNSRYSIGTAENTEFGRSQTITNLHLSEAAFYPHLSALIAGAAQAVTQEGYMVIETTANGFNEFRELWGKSVLGETNFKPLFYKASDFYPQSFLDEKRRELGSKFNQEYPESPEMAFITSGSQYFDNKVLQEYLQTAREPLTEGLIYG